MKINHDGLTMDDGTTYYAHAGIVGLGTDLDITYGYDGGFGDLPAHHRKEIAAYMIEQWTRVLNGEEAASW